MSVGCLPSCQGSGGHSRASNGISNRPFTALSLSLSPVFLSNLSGKMDPFLSLD